MKVNRASRMKSDPILLTLLVDAMLRELITAYETRAGASRHLKSIGFDVSDNALMRWQQRHYSDKTMSVLVAWLIAHYRINTKDVIDKSTYS